MDTNCKHKHLLNIISLALVFLTISYGCANIKLPSGGPKDTVPPKLLKVEPANEQTEFKSKKIVLSFSKPVKLVSPNKEIVVTPEMSIPPTFMDKKNTIIVAINDDKLRPNSTYSINFGKAVADITEGNLADTYKYVFSTGPTIDSLSISGDVKYNIDTTEIRDVLVGIYDLKAQDILKDNPLWFTYTDEKGKFSFTNLSPGKYKIYAFTNKDKSRRFDYKKLLAFLPYDLDLNKNFENVNLILSRQVPDNIKILDKEFKESKICLTLNAVTDPIDIQYSAKMDNSDKQVNLILATDTPSDTICFFPSTIKFNSLEITLGNKEIDYDKIVINNFNPNAKPSNVDITTNLNGSVLTDALLKLKFSFPIESIDKNKVELTENGDKVPFGIQRIADTNPMDYKLLYNWNKGYKYTLTILLQAVKSIYGGENLEFKREFTVNNTQDTFGSLKIDLELPENEQYIVRLVNSSRKVISEKVVAKSSILDFPMLSPGGYHLFFIHDLNKNGKWDLASFTKNRQAEPVFAYPNLIEIRANWEINHKYSLKENLDASVKKQFDAKSLPDSLEKSD